MHHETHYRIKRSACCHGDGLVGWCHQLLCSHRSNYLCKWTSESITLINGTIRTPRLPLFAIIRIHNMHFWWKNISKSNSFQVIRELKRQKRLGETNWVDISRQKQILPSWIIIANSVCDSGKLWPILKLHMKKN